MACLAVTTSNHRKSRVNYASVYSRLNELYNHYNPRSYGRNNYHNLWVSIEKMVRRQYNTYFNVFWWDSGFRFGIQHDNSWFRFHTRNRRKSGKSGLVRNRNRQNHRNYCYYYLLIGLLSIGIPVRASEGETNNTSNPVAAATGNVTNQAVQFQNNGAPSRQAIGPNISCNGATMTFSPFYMGNHTTPYDENMDQQSYTVAENWGGQINFMVPLDGSLVERCKAAATRQIQKMELDYELVRVKNCAELQQKGFMLVPGSRVYHVCSDVVPIAAFQKEVKKELEKQCKPIEEFRFPWQKKRQKCPKKFKPINPKLLFPNQAKLGHK